MLNYLSNLSGNKTRVLIVITFCGKANLKSNATPNEDSHVTQEVYIYIPLSRLYLPTNMVVQIQPSYLMKWKGCACRTSKAESCLTLMPRSEDNAFYCIGCNKKLGILITMINCTEVFVFVPSC